MFASTLAKKAALGAGLGFGGLVAYQSTQKKPAFLGARSSGLLVRSLRGLRRAAPQATCSLRALI